MPSGQSFAPASPSSCFPTGPAGQCGSPAGVGGLRMGSPDPLAPRGAASAAGLAPDVLMGALLQAPLLPVAAPHF